MVVLTQVEILKCHFDAQFPVKIGAKSKFFGKKKKNHRGDADVGTL